MSIRLSGAALAALLSASVAEAQLLVTNSDGRTQARFAHNIDLATAGYEDMLSVTLSAGGDEESVIRSLGASDDIDVTVRLTDGLSFNGHLTGTSVVNTDGAAAGDCGLGLAADGIDGGQTVTYSSVGNASFDPTNCDWGGGAQHFAFAIPIAIGGTGTVEIDIALTATGTPLASATYQYGGSQDFVSQLSTWLGGSSSLVVTLDLATGYQSFVPSGSITASFAGYGSFTLSNGISVYSYVGPGGADDILLDYADASQFEGAELVVSANNPAGLDEVTIAGLSAGPVSIADGSATFALSPADLGVLDAGAATSLTLDTANPAAVQTQLLLLSGTVRAAAGSKLQDFEVSKYAFYLDRQISRSDTFEWVGDSTAATRSVFRFTGLDDTLPEIRVNLRSTTNEAIETGPYPVTPAAAPIQGELIVTVDDFDIADFGRSDLYFEIEALGVTVRRLLVTNGVVSEMATDYTVGAGQIGD
ncbi:hypothetical protein [Maricaulis sp. CAU 1757]